MRTEYRIHSLDGVRRWTTEDPLEIVRLQAEVQQGKTRTVRIGPDGTEQLVWENVFPAVPPTVINQKGFRLVPRT